MRSWISRRWSLTLEAKPKLVPVAGFTVASEDALEASSALLVGGVVAEREAEDVSPALSHTVMQDKVEVDDERVIAREAMFGKLLCQLGTRRNG